MAESRECFPYNNWKVSPKQPCTVNSASNILTEKFIIRYIVSLQNETKILPILLCDKYLPFATEYPEKNANYSSLYFKNA